MDIDYFWHFKAGEYMVEHSTILTHDIFSWSVIGKSWMSHEWLFEVLIYLLFTVFHSYHLFIYVFGICVVLLFFLFWVQRKEYLKNIPFALFWTSFYMLIFIGLSGRPHLLSYLLLAITLYLLFYYFYYPDSKRIYFLPLISLIWVNVHGGSSNLVYLFCFLFLLVGLVQFSFSKIEAKRLSRKQILTYLVVGLLSIFVLVINPHGVKMLLYPYQNMADTLMLSSISEWQPSNLNIPTHYIYYFFSLVVLIIMMAVNVLLWIYNVTYSKVYQSIVKNMSYSVITDNSFFGGFTDKMVFDAGGHGEQFVMSDNVGCPAGK